MSNAHPAEVHTTFKSFSEDMILYRKARIAWKNHLAKHGKSPMIIKCDVCSGREMKIDIKLGKWKAERPCKVIRDELRIELTDNF
jgi:hypothetical protein